MFLGPWRTGDYLVFWVFSHPDVDDGKIKGTSGFADIKLETTTYVHDQYLSTFRVWALTGCHSVSRQPMSVEFSLEIRM